MTQPQESNPRPDGAQPLDEDENLSLVSEFIWFIKDNKKWWLVPLVLVFLFLMGVIFLGTNPATAPFIYSLF